MSRLSTADVAAEVRRSGLVATISDATVWRWLQFVLSADEKTSSQARVRAHRSLRPRPGTPAKVEHEYTRGGAWAYLPALDVHRARLFGRCEPTTGIAPFERLIDQVMTQAPYRDARRVFWILDDVSTASTHFRISAGMTYDERGSKLSRGP